MIPLAEHDEPSLAAQKKQRHVALEKATPTPKNRVWNFFGSPLGRPGVEPDLSAETATGSVQFSYENASGRAYYYTRDHLGSVRELCNSSGTILTRYSYDPYGKTTTSYLSGSVDSTKQYAGMYMHQQSGEYETVGRIYDTSTGHWLSRDPLAESGGINLYDYCLNEPIRETDGLGLVCVDSLQLIHSGPMKGGKSLNDYFPNIDKTVPGFAPDNRSQTGPFFQPNGAGDIVQIVANTSGSGTVTFTQFTQQDGQKAWTDDVKKSGQNPSQPPFMQPLPGGSSWADIPGSPGLDQGIVPTTFITTVYSNPSGKECCKYGKCSIMWHQDTGGNIRIIASWCE